MHAEKRQNEKIIGFINEIMEESGMTMEWPGRDGFSDGGRI